mgnify:FL=1|tara:strand:- start:6438 stop:6827 length:390 start_codon:yes stop_codon:yes gene_type:complete
MTVELEMLTWTAIATLLMWPPYILAHIANVGMVEALTYRADGAALPGWAARAKKAHYNAIENLLPFAVLILVAHAVGVSNAATQSAAMAFFGLRLAHYAVYVFGVPFGRTLTFVGSWLAQLCIVYQLLV